MYKVGAMRSIQWPSRTVWTAWASVTTILIGRLPKQVSAKLYWIVSRKLYVDSPESVVNQLIRYRFNTSLIKGDFGGALSWYGFILFLKNSTTWILVTPAYIIVDVSVDDLLAKNPYLVVNKAIFEPSRKSRSVASVVVEPRGEIL